MYLSCTGCGKAMFGAFAGSSRSRLHLSRFTLQRTMHSRNKKALECIARGWSRVKEVDRVIDHAAPYDSRLLPDLRRAKAEFELALEVDEFNTRARYWLAKLHSDYHTPGGCRAVSTALLTEAADMGNPDAQYELGRRLRIEDGHPDPAGQLQLSFHYIREAVDQLHPPALFLLGIVLVTGDCIEQDVGKALWCFHRASQKGHAGAALAYGSLLLKGHQLPESLTKFYKKRPSLAKSSHRVRYTDLNPLEMAKKQFEIAANVGCELGFKWLNRIEEEEKRVLASEALAAKESKDSEVTSRQ